jgi:hypothetical protein
MGGSFLEMENLLGGDDEPAVPQPSRALKKWDQHAKLSSKVAQHK